jgi:AraC-like DNA-binding protein
MIHFGPMSITLLLGALYGAMFAGLLWWSKRNRTANRLLALLLIVIALRMLPYIIGFAGYFDKYPWLSFLPYEASLAFGPLLYLYTHTLFAAPDKLPRNAWWHFLPVSVQVLYYCTIFPFPLEFKNHWNSSLHVPVVMIVEQAGTFASIAIYWAMSLNHYRRYQRWLVENVSDREDHHIEWVRNFLIALAITLVFWMGLALFEIFFTLNYFDRFPFYVWLTVLSYYLGTEGFRHAAHRYPPWHTALPSVLPLPAPAIDVVAERAGLRANADKWRRQIAAEQWWRDPELTLASLARKLGTNTSDLSRAINDGLGLNFNELINRMRVESVKQSLADNDKRNLLEIAFAAGFSSKASFNRSFKLYAGETPTAYREKFDRAGLKS